MTATRYVMVDHEGCAHSIGDGPAAAALAHFYLATHEAFDRVDDAISELMSDTVELGAARLSTRGTLHVRSLEARAAFRYFKGRYFARPTPRPRPMLRELERRAVDLLRMIEGACLATRGDG